MTHPHDLSPTPLARRALLSLQGGTGQAVGVFSGSVWVTEEGEPDDHVLGAGESMALRRPGLALVEALQDSQLVLFETGGSPTPWHGPLRESLPAGGHARSAGSSGATDTHGADAVATGLAQHLPTVELERAARELRRQAVRDGVARLARWIGQAFARPTTTPATPQALRGPRPLAWQARH